MQLYSGLSTEFIRDSVHNRIAEKLKDAFFRQFRHHPPQSELNSWRNSLRAVSQVLDDAKLHDHGILLEYQLPMSSRRLDCMVTGQDAARRDSAVIIELKQWDRCAVAGADNLVSTRVGGAERRQLPRFSSPARISLGMLAASRTDLRTSRPGRYTRSGS